MSLTDTQKVDFLWKRTVYQVTETNTDVKQGYEETIGSVAPLAAKYILAESLPIPAPNATEDPVQYYGTSNALQMTADNTVSGNATWLATTTHNTLSSRVGLWVPPAIDPGYLVQIYKNDATVSGNSLNQGTTGYEWVFDYNSGTLTFPNSVPSGITTLWLVGHRYTGRVGLWGAGAPVQVDQLTVSGLSNPVTSNYTFSNFFTYLPQNNSESIFIDGVMLNSADYTIGKIGGSGNTTDLTLNMSTIPYPLENGDVVSASYAYAQ